MSIFDKLKLGKKTDFNSKLTYTTAIILSAGSSNRMGDGINKQFVLLDGKPVLYYSVKAFEDSDLIDEIYIISKKENFDEIKNLLLEYKFKKVKKIITGGATRQESVEKGIKYIDKNKVKFVAIHDGARPLVKPHDISLVCINAYKNKASILATKSTDTVKLVENGRFVSKTVDRNTVYSAQTPQIFSLDLYLNAINKAKETELEFTDDSSMVENLGVDVSIVESSKENIKITYKEDLIIAEAILKSRKEQ